MSKKISLILAIVLALVGVVVVSVFGKLPEYLQPKVLMQDIDFVSEEITTNNKGDKIYYMDISANNLSVDLYSMVEYKPYNTTNINMKFVLTLKSGDGEAEDYAKVTKTGFLTFKEDMIDQFKDNILVVTVNSQDGSQLSDSIMIMKPSTDSNSSVFEDWDPWA